MSGSRVSVVYFLLVESDPLLVKVGYSRDWDKRHAQHQKSKLGVSIPTTPLAVVRGSAADEKAILEHFREVLVSGEQEVFHVAANTPLANYIRWLRDHFYVWVPEDAQGIPVDDLPGMDSSDWLPQAGREKAVPPQQPLFGDTGPLLMPQRVVTGDDYYTHADVIEAARKVLDPIDLDPASHPVANRQVRAARFYSFHENGLLQEWSGNVWLNPPFSQWDQWAPKALVEWRSGRVRQLCIYMTTATMTARCVSGLHETATALCVTRGRFNLWGPKSTSTATGGHAIFYFGPDPVRFADAMQPIGNVWFSSP